MCEHKNEVKAGFTINRRGIFQRYLCKDCGAIITKECVKEFRPLEEW